jgi:hypothetical protein
MNKNQQQIMSDSSEQTFYYDAENSNESDEIEILIRQLIANA